MRIQIRTLQVPTAWGTAAFTPVPAASWSAEFNGQNIVTGAPGNVPVYSPRPAALNDSSLGGPYNQPSDVAPNYILPSIYVAHVNRSMRFPSSALGRRMPSPVRAVQAGTAVVNLWGKPRIGGDTVTPAIRPFTQWRTYGSRK